MSGWSPPSIPPQLLPVIVVLYAALLVYSLIVVQRILLAAFVGVLIAAVYFAYRLLLAVEAIADAQQRIASAREQS